MYINRHFVYIRSSIIINYYCYFLWNNYTIAFIEVHFIITVFIFNIINYCFLFKIFSYYDSTIKTAMGTGSDKNFINVYLRKSAVSRHFTFYYLSKYISSNAHYSIKFFHTTGILCGWKQFSEIIDCNELSS